MTKLLLAALLLWIVWRWAMARRRHPPRPPRNGAVQMLECAHCQVRFPQPEAVQAEGAVYCCAQHAHSGPVVRHPAEPH